MSEISYQLFKDIRKLVFKERCLNESEKWNFFLFLYFKNEAVNTMSYRKKYLPVFFFIILDSPASRKGCQS